MRLPPLRPDLQLSPAAPAADGTPQWTLADPLRGRYFKLGGSAIRLLRHWARGAAPAVLAAANAEPGAALGADELAELLGFLRGHDLIAALDAEQRASYAPKAASRRRSLWQQALHQYLFFRIPLWRPDPFLNRTWPWLQRHGPRLLRIALPLVLGLGGLLVARDWERFIASFPFLFSLGGMLAFGGALLFAKLCHEFGHAYMAKRAGCRVQSMGLAFMVLVPLFYTDVSDAWRVNDRRSRLLIGAGGVLAELLLASVALLAWSLLPDGPARTAAFLLASATWLTTVAVNLNPLMRFDGYFLLGDLWGVDNLQARAFALCRWRLREALLGLGEPAPEPWPTAMRRRLLLWGYCSWLWRAALFFGIALTVYHLFFKMLGIFLMLVELSWFIALPIGRECRVWWLHRRRVQQPQVRVGGKANHPPGPGELIKPQLILAARPKQVRVRRTDPHVIHPGHVAAVGIYQVHFQTLLLTSARGTAVHEQHGEVILGGGGSRLGDDGCDPRTRGSDAGANGPGARAHPGGAPGCGRCPELRLILFAGEVFPSRQLAALREAFPGIACYNLYGPTETNVDIQKTFRDAPKEFAYSNKPRTIRLVTAATPRQAPAGESVPLSVPPR